METNNIIPLTTFEGNFAQQGWQCPICKRVYSPTTPMCLHCGNYELTTTTNTKSDEDFRDITERFNEMETKWKTNLNQ